MDMGSFCNQGGGGAAPAAAAAPVPKFDLNSVLSTPAALGGSGATPPQAPNPYGSYPVLNTPRMAGAGAAPIAFSKPATPQDPGVPPSFMDYLGTKNNSPTGAAPGPAPLSNDANAENAAAAKAAGSGIGKFIGHF